MEWTSPRPQHQFAFPQQFQTYQHYEDDDEESQEQVPHNVMLQSDRYAALLPPRPNSSLKTEIPNTFGDNGDTGVSFQPLNLLGMPQIEETTEFQPFSSPQATAYPNNSIIPSSLPPLPPQQQPQHEPQYGAQLPIQFSSQFADFPTESASYYPALPLPQLPPMPIAHRLPVDYFPEGIPTLHSVRSSAPTLPSSFGLLEQQQQQQLSVFEEQDDSVGHDTSPAMFSSEFTTTSTDSNASLRAPLTLPMGNYPAEQSSSVGTPPVYSPVLTPLSRTKRGSELREPFSQMATTHEPKFSPDKRKLCCVEGCTSQARAFNRCKRHGGSKRCSSPGCTKSVQSRGLCIRHGGGSRCQESGCTRASQSHGRCKMHGGGRPCIIVGCEKKAHLKQLCRRHGGGTKCSVTGCDKWAQRQGMCMTHSKVVEAHSSAFGTIGDAVHFDPKTSPPPTSPSSSPLTSLRIFPDAA